MGRVQRFRILGAPSRSSWATRRTMRSRFSVSFCLSGFVSAMDFVPKKGCFEFAHTKITYHGDTEDTEVFHHDFSVLSVSSVVKSVCNACEERHTFLSVLRYAEVDVEAIAKFLGNAAHDAVALFVVFLLVGFCISHGIRS